MAAGYTFPSTTQHLKLATHSHGAWQIFYPRLWGFFQNLKSKSGLSLIIPWAGNCSELGTASGAKAGYRNFSPSVFLQLNARSYPSTF